MRPLWWVLGALGVLAVLLGGLWLLQGTGLVAIEPVACVGACEPVEAPSLVWSSAGAGVAAAGAACVGLAARRLRC